MAHDGERETVGGSLLSYSRGLWRFGVFVFACSGDYASLAHVLLPCRGRMIL